MLKNIESLKNEYLIINPPLPLQGGELWNSFFRLSMFNKEFTKTETGS